MDVSDFLSLDLTTLSKKTGWSLSQWSCWACGVHSPNIKFIEELAKRLEMHPIKAFQAFYLYREQHQLKKEIRRSGGSIAIQKSELEEKPKSHRKKRRRKKPKNYLDTDNN